MQSVQLQKPQGNHGGSPQQTKVTVRAWKAPAHKPKHRQRRKIQTEGAEENPCPTLCLQHCFECLAGGVSPEGSLDLALAKICLRASWVESNFPSTLVSKVAWRASIFSNLSSSRCMRASSGLAEWDAIELAKVQALGGSVEAGGLFFPFWPPLPPPLPGLAGAFSTSWIRMSTTSALIWTGKEDTVGLRSVATIQTWTPAARKVLKGRTGSFNA